MDPLQFFLIKNNVKTNDINILKDLTNLKNLYSRQLAKMPREYIVKLLFDTVHESLIVKMGQKIVAGVTFRGFKDRPFYEIAFLAVNKEDQCTGLGSKVMNKFKNHCQSQEIEHVFTFADDGAIGFF
jgi:histone acetyltransferase